MTRLPDLILLPFFVVFALAACVMAAWDKGDAEAVERDETGAVS